MSSRAGPLKPHPLRGCDPVSAIIGFQLGDFGRAILWSHFERVSDNVVRPGGNGFRTQTTIRKNLLKPRLDRLSGTYPAIDSCSVHILGQFTILAYIQIRPSLYEGCNMHPVGNHWKYPLNSPKGFPTFLEVCVRCGKSFCAHSGCFSWHRSIIVLIG